MWIHIAKPKEFKRKGYFKKAVVLIDMNICSLMFRQKLQLRKRFGILVVYGESWWEIAPWLSCCLHRLLTIVSLAADLVHQDCIISGRMAKVHSLSTKTVWSIWGLFFFWSGTPLPASPLHRITEADLFWISFIGLAVYWTLVSQLLPAHLSDAIFLLKSLLELFLKHFCLSSVKVTRQIVLVFGFQQII